MNEPSHRKPRLEVPTGASRSLSGVLNINKPPGVTSRRVVDVVDRIVRPAKAGHAGTLDPLACGVLIVCVGQATRLIEYVQRMPKRYIGTFLLGCESDTEDIEGDVRELTDPPRPTLEQIHTAATALTGEIMQRPPAYSALKVKGQRAYDLARAGHEVQLAPRPITIHRLEISEYNYPRLALEIECSSGTYVRSLGRDLAQSLGTGAVMSALTRTAIGNFKLEEALDVDSLTRENFAESLLPIGRAVQGLTNIVLSTTQISHIRNGRSIDCPTVADAELAAFDSSGNLLAILTRKDGKYWPTRNFATSATA